MGPRPFASVRVTEQRHLHVLPPKTEERLRPVARDTRQLDEQCKVHPLLLVLHRHFRRSPERPEQLKLVLGAHYGLRLLSRHKAEFFHEPLLHLRPN